MAAGMGSRYGGLKQIDSVGPNGEYLIDYSVYDAIQAGFNKIVFVIRSDFATEFCRHFNGDKFSPDIEIKFVNQEMNDLPVGCQLQTTRTKPWGTGHAVWVARDLIHEPFAVISADDFYGREALKDTAKWLESLPVDSRAHYAVVGYKLAHTLSPNGWVSRGLLMADGNMRLTSIHEHTKIGWVEGQIVSRDKQNIDHLIDKNRLVSMVLFAFTPDFFDYLEQDLCTFIQAHGHDDKLEFFTPNVVNHLIQDQIAQMQVLPTQSHWFGVTYVQDKRTTVEAIASLIKQGVYPLDLWGK